MKRINFSLMKDSVFSFSPRATRNTGLALPGGAQLIMPTHSATLFHKFYASTPEKRAAPSPLIVNSSSSRLPPYYLLASSSSYLSLLIYYRLDAKCCQNPAFDSPSTSLLLLLSPAAAYFSFTVIFPYAFPLHAQQSATAFLNVKFDRNAISSIPAFFLLSRSRPHSISQHHWPSSHRHISLSFPSRLV